MSTDLSTQRGTTTQTTDLSVTVEQTRELAVSQQQAMARYEIEGAIVIAKKFPRNEEAAYTGIIKACRRMSFANDSMYSFPRGNEDIVGPSVYLAREMARLWGNIRYGFDVISDDDDSRVLRAWAWDIQTNTRTSADASFKKLIYRRKGGWQTPDERDLRELTNRHAAFAVRNALLSLMPSDFIDDALTEAHKTIENGAKDNPDEFRKKTILAFDALGITADQLSQRLGKPIAQATFKELGGFRAIYASIKDGNSKWDDYVGGGNGPKKDETDKSGQVTGSDLSGGKASTTERPGTKREMSREELQSQADADHDSKHEAAEAAKRSSAPVAGIVNTDDREAFFASVQAAFNGATAMGKVLKIVGEVEQMLRDDGEILRFDELAKSAKDRVKVKK
jgi:hypothetical protein